MHNSVVRFTFFVFNRKYPSWENLVPKLKIICLNRNLMPRLIRLGSIQWWCSIFLSQGRKYLFWANLLQKIKIASLSLNLVPRLIQICRIQWWCSFSVITKLHFLGKFGPKNKNCQLKLKCGTNTNSNTYNSMVMLTFPIFDGKYNFG